MDTLQTVKSKTTRRSQGTHRNSLKIDFLNDDITMKSFIINRILKYPTVKYRYYFSNIVTNFAFINQISGYPILFIQ